MEDSFEQPVANGFLTVCSSKDMTGLLRSLNGRLTGVHKVLCSAAEIAHMGRHDFYLGHDGGHMIPIYSKIDQEMRNHFEKLGWNGKNELFPVLSHRNHLSSRETSMAEQCARKSNENSESRRCINW